MSFSITDLKTALGGGARANLFRVLISGVTDQPTADLMPILCRSASLPSSTIGIVEVAYNAGRRYKMGGERTFADWTTTILNDEDFTIRKSLEGWQAGIVDVDANSESVGFRNAQDSGIGAGLLSNPTVYVQQLDDSGEAVKTYKLHHCWPSDISSIDLSYDNVDTVEEFTVTWTYDYFTESDVDVPTFSNPTA
jgi:hypothetical protein